MSLNGNHNYEFFYSKLFLHLITKYEKPSNVRNFKKWSNSTINCHGSSKIFTNVLNTITHLIVNSFKKVKENKLKH